MNVLLTGATGFLGFRTLEKLVEDSRVSKIVAVGRVIKLTHKVNHSKVEYILGDLIDEAFVNGVVKNMDVIIHAAAMSSPWGRLESFYSANVLVQKNLIHAAKKAGIKRFVYISSPSIYFELKDKLNIKESDPLPKQFINAYAKTKREAEILLQKSGIAYVAIRPRALIGRGDTVIMPRLIRACDEGKLKIMGSGKNIVDLTSVANVADSLLLSVFARDEALNQIYNISNGQPVLLWQKIDYILKMLDKNLPQKKAPFWLIKSIAKLLELQSKLTNMKEPALTIYGVGTLSKSFTLDISKAQKLLGYKPIVSTDKAIEEFIQWYKNEKN